MEIDLTKVTVNTSFAKTVTNCDYCGETLGSRYPNSYASHTVRLRKDKGTVGGDEWSEKEDHHFCGEGCMGEYMKGCAYADTEWRGKPSGQGDRDINAPDDIDPTNKTTANMETLATEINAKISSKERETLKSSSFLYPETRSYPIRNGEDVKNAIHAYGRGKNKDSYSTFISKLHRKAKQLGCEDAIPESTRKEHDLN